MAHKINYGANKGKAFTEEEDRFILCTIANIGYGAWDDLKAAIRHHWRFRFDWYFKSRTPQELQRRCDTLIRLIEKEQEDDAVSGCGCCVRVARCNLTYSKEDKSTLVHQMRCECLMLCYPCCQLKHVSGVILAQNSKWEVDHPGGMHYQCVRLSVVRVHMNVSTRVVHPHTQTVASTERSGAALMLLLCRRTASGRAAQLWEGQAQQQQARASQQLRAPAMTAAQAHASARRPLPAPREALRRLLAPQGHQTSSRPRGQGPQPAGRAADGRT